MAESVYKVIELSEPAQSLGKKPPPPRLTGQPKACATYVSPRSQNRTW